MIQISDVIRGCGIEARDYQTRVTSLALTHFADGSNSVMIESPTGSGKTVMGHLVAKCLQQMYPDLVIGWVAMRRNLLSQAARENVKIGVNNIHYVSMFDSNPERLLSARAAGKKILLIIDEAQHDAASSMASLHEAIQPDMILGLTATPFRTDSVQLCFNNVIKDAGIHQLIQDGYLSRYNHWVIDNWTPENVVRHYVADPERWGKSVVFFLEWDQCEQFRTLLLQHEGEIREKLACRADIPLGKSLVASVRGGGSVNERESILDAFACGDIAVLVNCMVLTEGFDCPTLTTAFVRDSVRGPTIQMAGRAFRKHPLASSVPKFAVKNIVQSGNSKWPITKTAMASCQYQWMETEWRSLTINPKIDEIQNNVRSIIASIETSLPDFLNSKKGKRKVRFGDNASNG